MGKNGNLKVEKNEDLQCFDLISKERHLLKIKCDGEFGGLKSGKCLNICFVKCNRRSTLINKRIAKEQGWFR